MSQKSFNYISITALVLMFLLLPKSSSADTSSNHDLLISQIKINTTSQFVSLYNNTDKAIDMATVSLQYFNNYQLSAVTSTKSIQLSGTLAPHSYYIINDGPINMCYQAMIQSASLGFSTKTGMVEVVRMSQQAGGIGLTSQDFVSWSSTSVSGVQVTPAEPAFLQRQQANGKPVVDGPWQQVKPTADNPCELVSLVAPTTKVTPANQLLPASPPPATIVSIASESTSNSKLPAADVGLKMPQLSEILPNPSSPQTDEKDEFIEIYNSNDVSFDLSGFKLQSASSASSTKHTYTFPSGTTIGAKSFAAYPSSNISLSLTNSGGQVWLVDPNDLTIGKTDLYQTAKDGMAWALADGKWYWTSKPTPSASNIILASDATKSATGSGVGTVKGVSTNTPNSGSTNNFGANSAAKPRSLNSTVLVGVGALAIIYGVYEYRRDLANAIHKLKRNRAVRRENRPKT